MEEVVQALPASSRKSKKTPTKQDAASPQPPSSSSKKTPTKRDAASPQIPSSSRCTRSKAAPDWTVQEMLILVAEIAAVDEDWLKALSSYQKWKMISENCIALDVNRSSNQCKTRWESLLADYRKIRDWESQPGVRSYWSLDSGRRKQYDLPASFEQEVFDSMDAVISTWDDRSGSGDSGSDDLLGTADVEMFDVGVDSGPEEKRRSETGKDTNKAREMAGKLQATAEQVHAILRGELMDDTDRSRALVDLTRPNSIETEFARRQADELIKAFGGLVGTLDQFTELIKDNVGEVTGPGNKLAL